MFLPEYRPFYERLLVQSKKYIQSQCKAKGSFENLTAGKKDVNYLNDYRYYAFTKSTKSLSAIVTLIDCGNYEDALILCRTIMECYLSQKYFDDQFDHETLSDMVMLPTWVNQGVLVYNKGSFWRRDGNEPVIYNVRTPDDFSLGRDKRYFIDLYNFLCEIAHCNYSQAGAFLDDDGRFTLYSAQNREAANLFPLFIFSKLFENVVLLESTRFIDKQEEQEAIDLLVELTVFLYDKLNTMFNSLEKGKITGNYSFRDIAHDTMNSLKEQLGRVDKSFVQELVKQHEKTPIEKNMLPALLNSDKPSVFFEKLRQSKKFKDNFPELAALIGLEQNPACHREGDVWTHTMQALDRAAALRDKVSDPYAFMLLVLTHDFGKNTCFAEDGNSVIHSIGHEEKGLSPAARFLSRITKNEKVRNYVLEMMPRYAKVAACASAHPEIWSADEMFSSVAHPEDLICMAKADKNLSEADEASLWERCSAYLGKK